MILTITMNPSLDISYSLDKFSLNSVNRCISTVKTAGGKGLNVSRVLYEIGENVVATGLLGGKIGDYIEAELEKINIKNDFYRIKNESRNCIAILHEDNQTEILENGPLISDLEADEFLKHFEKLLLRSDVITISGSLPKGLNSNYYVKMLEISSRHLKPIIIDCSGDNLKRVVINKYKPTFIKPNIDEMSQLVGTGIDYNDIESLKRVTDLDLFAGIEWVMISLGEKGSFAKHNNKYYKVNIPKINVINPVGSGDASIAGVASGIKDKLGDEALLKKANTLGILNAMEIMTGHINYDNYEKIFNQIEVLEV